MESMGFKTFGSASGDTTSGARAGLLGAEDAWLGDERYSGDRDSPVRSASVQMGLIYVNPEGPTATGPACGRRDIRETFSRMAMNDEETVALIIGGPRSASAMVRSVRTASVPNPRLPPSRRRAWAGKQLCRGKGGDTITSGARGRPWTNEPTKWDNGVLENLFKYDWELTESPAGAKQWTPRIPRPRAPCRRP